MLFFLKKIQRSTTCGKNTCLPVGWEVEKNFLKHADTIKFQKMAQSPLQRRGYGYNSVFFTCPGGEIGRRRGLKTPRRKVCRFESDPGHQILKTAAFFGSRFLLPFATAHRSDNGEHSKAGGGLCLSSAAGCWTCRLKTEDWLKDSAECRKENCSENSDMQRNCRWPRRLRPSCWPVPDATLPSSNPKNRRIGPKVGKTGQAGGGFLSLRIKTTV